MLACLRGPFPHPAPQPLTPASGFPSLAALADNVGVPAMGLNKDALKTLQDLLNEHNANPYILDTGAPLMAALNEAFAGGAEALLEDRLQQLPGLHEDLGEWMEVVGPDGKVYYTNPKTGEVQWNEPPEHLAFLNELDNILGLMENLDGDMSDIDPALADGLANIIGERPKDKRVMQKVEGGGGGRERMSEGGSEGASERQ